MACNICHTQDFKKGGGYLRRVDRKNKTYVFLIITILIKKLFNTKSNHTSSVCGNFLICLVQCVETSRSV